MKGIPMNQSALIIQNQLHEMTVSVERAYHVKCDSSWKSGNFIPPFSSIGLILEGEGTMRVNDAEIHPLKGQLYLLPARTVQSFFTEINHPYEKYYCHFEARCGGVELFEIIDTPLCIDAKDSAVAAKIFDEMIKCIGETGLTSMIKVKQYMLDLLGYYLECCPVDKIRLVENNCDSPLSKAIHFAENNLHENVTVKKMAEIAGYHPSHFTKLFHKRLGVSPVQFIVRKKTEQATKQLTATTLSISAIAESLGFSNQFYFSNFFKKQTGMTPTEYRNTYGRTHL